MGSVSIKILRVAAVVTALAFVGACASGGGSADKPKQVRKPVPASSPLAKIKEGMSDLDVRTKLGEPSHVRSHITGLAWIPFYYGSDTSRIEWWYKGKGVVSFNSNRWTGTMRVREVIYDPKALK